MASIEYVVNATDAASRVFEKIGLSADHLDQQLEDLGKRVADPEVNLQDSKFTLGMIRAAERLDKLSAQVADPKVEVDTAKAQVEILRINASLDRLGARKVDVIVDVDRRRGIFSRIGGGISGAFSRIGGILGGIGGGIGAAGSTIGGIGSSLGQYGQALMWPAIIGAAAAGAPALLPLGLGLFTGAGAAGGALMSANFLQKQLTSQQALLNRIQALRAGTMTAANRRTLALDLATYQQGTPVGQLRSMLGPLLGVQNTFQDVGMTAMGTFARALEARGPAVIGPSGRPIPGSGAPSFLTGLTGILQQLGGFIKSIGPELAQMFRASIPFLSMFVKFLEQAAKALLPAFLQMLNEMQPLLPVMSKGLMDIVRGFAGFLNAIGPSGMKASARIFVILAEGMAAALVALGHTVNWLVENIPKWARFIVNEWKTLRHDTADVFDGIRHDIAGFFHGVAADFDAWRHGWAHAWDVIYSDTVGAVIRIDRGIISWFDKIPGQILGALRGLGHSLYAFASAALNEMWAGMKSVFSSVWNWFGSLPGKLLGAIGIHSPPDWAIEAGKHIMGGLLHGITSRKNELLDAFKDITAFGTAGGARVGPSAAAAMRYAQSLFPRYGWSMALWPALRSLWMGESGWNYQARNPSSGAYGIPQALPAGKMASAGADWLTNAATQIRWGLSYIASVYGNPGAAYNMWLSRSPHWYGTGLAGGIFTSPTLIGVGERGPERVDITPAGSRGGGNTYNITVMVGHGTHPVAAAKEIARLLNDGAKSGVKLRTSILGPG